MRAFLVKALASGRSYTRGIISFKHSLQTVNSGSLDMKYHSAENSIVSLWQSLILATQRVHLAKSCISGLRIEGSAAKRVKALLSWMTLKLHSLVVNYREHYTISRPDLRSLDRVRILHVFFRGIKCLTRCLNIRSSATFGQKKEDTS